MFMFTGLGITLNTCAWKARRIRSLVASAVISTAGSDAIERLANHRERFQPRQPRHVHVEQDQVNEVHLHQFHGLAAILREDGSESLGVRTSPSASRVPRSSSAIRTEKRW